MVTHPHSLVVEALISLRNNDEEQARKDISFYTYEGLIDVLVSVTKLNVIITDEMSRKSPYKK
jgi:hypothetical protein